MKLAPETNVALLEPVGQLLVVSRVTYLSFTTTIMVS